MIIPVGITQAVADGRYVQLAPSTVQTGAKPLLELASGKSLLVLDYALAAMLRLQDGGGTTAYDAIVIGNSTPSPGNVLIVPPSPTGYITLGGAGQPVQTGRNTLDDGSGNELAAGNLTVFSGIASPVTSETLLAVSASRTGYITTDTLGDLNLAGHSGLATALIRDDGVNILVGNLAIRSTGNVGVFSGIATAGKGVSPIFAAGLLISLNTTSTVVCSYTPGSSSGQSFTVKWRLSCATASTPDLKVTYTDPKAGLQSIVLYNTAMLANTAQGGVFPIVATNAGAITITGTDSVALGDIFATAEILEDQ